MVALLNTSCQDNFGIQGDEETFDNEQNLIGYPVKITITNFLPPSGDYYSGNTVTSKISFKNSGKLKWTFWVGYSVQDRTGLWYDITSNPVTLYPGQVSSVQSKSWVVPPDPKITSGSYKVRMAIWSSRPEDGPAIRLDYREQDSSFMAFNFIDHFSVFNDARWVKGNHRTPGTTARPGLGFFQPENVTMESGKLLLRHPANTKNGGEIESVSPYTYSFGTYRTNMKCPALPGTITTLFTYEGVDYGDEIDLEIWNDGSGKVIFTIWKSDISSITGQSVYSNTINLGFDPSVAFHEYRIDFYPDGISWYIDGIQKDKTTLQSNFPNHSMHLMVNTWWPNWPGWEKYTSNASDRFAEYHSIQH